MSRLTNIFASCASATTLFLSLVAPAQAADTVCGTASASWNAPNGAAVNSRSPSGVVAAILGQLGEYYSHTMLSHGATQMSHASMKTPRANAFLTANDDWELSDILTAGPGAATIGMGGTYAFLYQQSTGAPSAVDYVDGGADGIAAANAILALPDCSTISNGKCRTAIDDPASTSGMTYPNGTAVPVNTPAQPRYIIGLRVNGVTYRQSYGVYTFVNGYDVAGGEQTSAPYAGLNCSLFMAMAFNWGTGAAISQHTYPNSIVSPAAQMLYDTIYDLAGAAGGNATTQTNLANQMTNCFTSPSACADITSGPWTAFKATGTATTISPDRIRGISGHSDVVSPWTGATQTVQWNAPGNTYGCWSEDVRTWLEPAPWNNATGTGGSGGSGSCVPTCDGDLCGQFDGCGGVCPSTDSASCGMCGNAPCSGGTCPQVQEVNIGTSVPLHYTITGTDVTVTLGGGTGDGDIYVKLGSAPTTSSYDCRSWASGNAESCTVSGTGTFHIMLDPYSPVAGTTLHATLASCSGACVPVCGSDLCGQSDGCGGFCDDTNATACGHCGNPACDTGGTCPTINALSLSGSSGSELRYTIEGTDVAVNLAGGSGDADLYVKLGSAPTTSSYTCRSNGSTNSEVCNASGTGIWHILVRGYSTYSGASLQASVASCSGGTCTPSCSGDLCGQSDGCGGTCPTTDASACGKCGNAACTGGTCSSLDYSASSTSSALNTDTDTRKSVVALTAGTTYAFSSCAAATDTYLRLYQGSTSKAVADDGCPSGYGSLLTFTPSTTGNYNLYLGCYNNTSCSATVSVSPAADSCGAVVAAP